MPIEFRKKLVVLREVVSVDEAEGLLECLQRKPAIKVDLAACTHLHPANLQVLMAARAAIAAWPEDQALRTWIEPALSRKTKE